MTSVVRNKMVLFYS